MHLSGSKTGWKRWLKPSRLVPLLTIVVAGGASILSLLGVITTSVPESIILALLALLAVDALTERLGILEGIESKLNTLPAVQMLRKRVDIPSVREQASHASEICVIAISAISLSVSQLSFFESKVKEGCKIRIVLLDPDSPALPIWNLQTRITTTESDIRSTLQNLKGLVLMEKAKGKCEIRLSNVFLAFSMFAVDLRKETGSMVVEYHTYKTTFSERPHVFLTPLGDPFWFDFYRQQFESAWSKASTWTP